MLGKFLSRQKKFSFIAKLGAALSISIGLGIYAKRYVQIDDWIYNLSGTTGNELLNFIIAMTYISGDVFVAGSVVAIGLGWMVWRKYWHEAIAFAFGTLGILIMVDRVLKPLFDRNRPPKPRLVEDVSRHSFPSGHAAGNVVLYFYLSFVIAAKYPRLKVYVYGISTIIVVAIGFASVYTKAHWLSDVLAGYIFGYIWLIVSLNLLKFLQRKQKHIV